MFPTEKKAYEWLLSEGYPKDSIIYQKTRSPDFLIGDKGFEVKKHGNTIHISKVQFGALKKTNSTILVFSESSSVPTLIIPPNLIEDGKIVVGVKIKLFDMSRTLVVADEVWRILTHLKATYGKNSYSEVIMELIKGQKVSLPERVQEEIRRLLRRINGVNVSVEW